MARKSLLIPTVPAILSDLDVSALAQAEHDVRQPLTQPTLKLTTITIIWIISKLVIRTSWLITIRDISFHTNNISCVWYELKAKVNK